MFAGNHGVTAQGVSAYPAEVTAQMVANFAAGGAAINQLAQLSGAELRVIALDLDHPTADFTKKPAMDEAEFLDAVSAGYDALSPEADLVVLGEMGIGNTTAASAIAAALFGGGGARFAGHGTGVDERGLERKREAIDAALARHSAILGDPLRVAAALRRPRACRHPRRRARRAASAHPGAARRLRLHRRRGAVGQAPRRRARPCARRPRVGRGGTSAVCFEELGLHPLLDLGMRLGEGSGAAVAVLILRAALACHTGMATFAAGAGVGEGRLDSWRWRGRRCR